MDMEDVFYAALLSLGVVLIGCAGSLAVYGVWWVIFGGAR